MCAEAYARGRHAFRAHGMGFDDVKVLRDATKGQINSHVRQLRDSVIRSGSIVLFSSAATVPSTRA